MTLKVTGYDFSGYATKNNVLCADGRTIKPDAFKDQDGVRVPLVWQHNHDSLMNVLGHGILENRPDGVYFYAFLNDTVDGERAKKLIKHGDVVGLSIYANQLIEKSKAVLHGIIREVSLVLSGANPGAFIDNTAFAHADDLEENLEEALIYSGEPIAVGELKHADSEESDDNKSIRDIFETLSEVQKTAVFAIIGQAIGDQEESTDNNEDVAQSAITDTETTKKEVVPQGEDNTMKQNVFDAATLVHSDNIKRPRLTTAQNAELFADAARLGSLKQSFLAHAGTYGIDNLDYLFPDARAVTNAPVFIQRQMEWVGKVLSGAHHSPFSRIKSLSADITVESARALGYVKGNLKKEEVFALLRRITTPATLYKKQKLDRDDIIDVTDLDVVSWLKAEMRVMFNEELARAILISDGRAVESEDKISTTNIRPIWTDDDMYSDKTLLGVNADVEDMIEAIIRARKNYRGSGSPTMFTSTDTLTDMLLFKLSDGRRMYSNISELMSDLRVKEIVEVSLMDNLSRTITDPAPATLNLKAIIVNMGDYTIGADRGGELSFFDDFDIDFNQYKYLYEARCSGALVTPKSALVIEQTASGD